MVLDTTTHKGWTSILWLDIYFVVKRWGYKERMSYIATMLMPSSGVVIVMHPYCTITSLCSQFILHMSRNIQIKKQRALYNVNYFILFFEHRSA